MKNLSRSNTFRYAFASAVGKRFYSERLTGPSKNSIIEHHRLATAVFVTVQTCEPALTQSSTLARRRSVHWSEAEYAVLLRVVQENERQLSEFLDEGELPGEDSPHAAMFDDYCYMMHPQAFFTENDILGRMQWGS